MCVLWQSTPTGPEILPELRRRRSGTTTSSPESYEVLHQLRRKNTIDRSFLWQLRRKTNMTL